MDIIITILKGSYFHQLAVCFIPAVVVFGGKVVTAAKREKQY